MENNIRMGRVFRALGDVHRLQILDMLSEREMNAGEILEAVDVVQSTLSHHMKTLTDAGLVGARRSGKWTYYTLDRAALEEAGLYLRTFYAQLAEEKEASEETAA
ncbi:MAG: winged helix-turn-helix transcriptional regulator, partial [Lachnospiraceae bacterium]|nr:winged helix-turn-helix transcriptional regulator [Lachnospiraceae bacterium]